MDVKLEKIILTDPPVDDCSTRSYPRTFHLQITDDMSEPDKAAGFENIRRTSYNNQSPQSKSSLGEMADEESFQTNKKWSPTHRTRQHDRWKTMSKMLSGKNDNILETFLIPTLMPRYWGPVSPGPPLFKSAMTIAV